ncbi:cyclopropane-fatty-acyl-phospholipid synthase family protein [Legionella sp. km772]|uniref:SAM-dependent methyltransferase n=1 Tax=Legionella sp. km772 TaxID=2498111 RepID=UPI000F8D93C9|nr:methyltransferase domain-containing protein [Legionella sp. km772]RUR12938.1 methyltransferase domain-containing protein [Legionella sp. km772]
MDANKLISHAVAPEALETRIKKIIERIKHEGDKPYCTVKQQLELLEQLQRFDFGRYLLQNQGINGYWTHYMLTYPWYGKKTGKNNRQEPLSDLERFMLERAPLLLATQQRFEIFLQENQKKVRNDAQLAAIPCGMMGELLYLDYEQIKTIALVGIDYDAETFSDAKLLAKQYGLNSFLKLQHRDAWAIQIENQLDLISSNGLTIYEPNQERVNELYQIFYRALKPNGKLVTSFLTYPPSLSPECEWNLDKIDQHDLLMQKIIFVDILEAKWQCYCSSKQVEAQLHQVGFKNIEFIYDEARMFPTVIAYK